jgi:hypothetical protein
LEWAVTPPIALLFGSWRTTLPVQEKLSWTRVIPLRGSLQGCAEHPGLLGLQPLKNLAILGKSPHFFLREKLNSIRDDDEIPAAPLDKLSVNTKFLLDRIGQTGRFTKVVSFCAVFDGDIHGSLPFASVRALACPVSTIRFSHPIAQRWPATGIATIASCTHHTSAFTPPK